MIAPTRTRIEKLIVVLFVIVIVSVFLIMITAPVFAATLSDWEMVGSAGFSTGAVADTTIAVSPTGVPYVAFVDKANSNKATVMKYDGSNWVLVGNAGFTPGTADETSIGINSAGVPYVAFIDGDQGNKLTVMKFDGVNWVTAGPAGISAGSVSQVSLVVDKDDGLMVVFSDDTEAGKATLMYLYPGLSIWQTFDKGFSDGSILYLSLALKDNVRPYVAFKDFSTADQALTVMWMQDSGLMANVGASRFSPGEVAHTSIAFDSSGTPHVAFVDQTINKTSVMKYDGANWNLLGNAGFVDGFAFYNSMLFNKNNVPFLAYRDANVVKKASAMKYEGGGWMQAGSAGLSDGEVATTDLAYDGDSTFYLVYEDHANANKVTVMKLTTEQPSQTQPTEKPLDNSIQFNLDKSGGTFSYTGNQVVVGVPANVLGAGFDYTGCSLSIGTPPDSNIDSGFNVDGSHYDISISCKGRGYTDLTAKITVCLYPRDGNNTNKYLWHKHSTASGWELLNTYAEIPGYACGGVDQLSLFALSENDLPATGFAPGIVEAVEAPMKDYTLSAGSGDIILEIPKIGVSTTIVGVPQTSAGWDVSWLYQQAGYLYGTAFPTWSGNTVLTGHVWGADNTPGIFYGIHQLQYGDQIHINAWGLTYTYEVRSRYLTYEQSSSPLKQTEYDMVTLITCEGFSEWTNDYRYRRVVQAVLVSVE